MKIFLDTSAFAKRYVAERGSDKVMALCEEADCLLVSVICLPELISTLSRLVREKKLSKVDYRQLKTDAMADLADIDICQITTEVLTSVVTLLARIAFTARNGCPPFGVRTDRRTRRVCFG